MAFCPATLKPCIDDLCYGSGCMRLPGLPLLIKCECGGLVGIDGTERDNCTCEPEDGLLVDLGGEG